MPTYRTPGVYVEETSYRTKSVTRAPSGVTGFVGPTLAEPDAPEALPALWSFTDFEKHYGGLDDLTGRSGRQVNYVAHAAQAFFKGGGRRLYVTAVPQDASDNDYARALDRFDAQPDIELVAAPAAAGEPNDMAERIARLLIAHVEGPGRHRFAVLDPPAGLSVSQVKDFRASYDTRRAALYYPWVEIPGPSPQPPIPEAPTSEAADTPAPGAPDLGVSAARLALPPSGFICGAYAATDAERGVWKAPANRVPIGATALQYDMSNGEQDVLNPLGVNCIRRFQGLGVVIWGARTLSSDPEFRYIHVRRLTAHIEASLARSLGWAAVEPNAARLWSNVAGMIQAFLDDLWRAGALRGDKPERAYFVRCGPDTMTAADIAAGRLVVLVGVAAIKPAEFIVLRVAADAAPTSPAPSGIRRRRPR